MQECKFGVAIKKVKLLHGFISGRAFLTMDLILHFMMNSVFILYLLFSRVS